MRTKIEYMTMTDGGNVMEWLRDAGAVAVLVGFWGVMLAWSQILGVLT